LQNFIKNNLCKVSRWRVRDRDGNPSRPRWDLRPGPALAVAGPNAKPGRGTQCKTKARGTLEQCFYDVNVFSQPCYDRGRAQICSKALTRELSTFANGK